MGDFTVGTQVIFDRHLTKWRKSMSELPLNEVTEASSSTRTSSPTFSVMSTATINPSAKETEKCDTVTLPTILMNTQKGLRLAEYYDTHKEFKQEHRSALINVIAEYFVDKNVHMSIKNSYTLEGQLLERFPSEKIVCIIH